MVRRTFFLVGAALFILNAWSGAFAADGSQSSFSISPPPIASPVFEVKETDLKVGGTYLTMKSTDPGIDFKLNGYGVNAVVRKSFATKLAFDYAVGLIYLSGDFNTVSPGFGGSSSGMKLSGLSIPMSFNLEFQPYKDDKFDMILFAGPALNLSAMTLDNVPTAIGIIVVNESLSIDSFMYGLQGGAQAGVGLGPLHVDVFGMVTSLQGSQSITHSLGGSDSSSIPAFTTTSFGVDFAYVPWGLTLSSILQEAKQSDNNGTKTNMYQLSWSRKF